MKNFLKNYWALCIPIAIIIIAILFLFRRAPQQNRVIGMVNAEFTDIAAELPGRLDSLLVKQGDTVKEGQLLAVLKGTEVALIQQQAFAAIQVARNQLDLLKSGPRSSVVQSAQNLQQIAQEQYNLAEKTYQRMQNLYRDSIVSGQEKDLIYFKYQAAQKELESAKAHAESLQSGSRPEMIAAAEAILQQAEQAYALSKSVAENTRIYAPVAGVISTLITGKGEIVSVGYPMMTIQKSHSYFVQFNVRQDQMKGLQEGDKVILHIPGAVPEKVAAVVSHIAPALDFANWVPEEQSGQFELRTFTLQCQPTEAVSNLRPGMTAALNLRE